jgi:hypothetical protein
MVFSRGPCRGILSFFLKLVVSCLVSYGLDNCWGFRCCEKLVAGSETVQEPTRKVTSPVEGHYSETANEDSNRLKTSNVNYSSL